MKRSTRLFLPMILLLLVTLACQAVLGTATPAITTAPVITLIPASETTSLPAIIATQPATTVTLLATATVHSDVTEQQVNIFEELWQAVNDNYVYPDFGGVDWNAIHVEFRQKIDAGLGEADYYNTLKDMIFRLGDHHSIYLDPQETAEEDAQYKGENNFVGIGVLTSSVPQRMRLAIILTFIGSPAEAAGIRAHDSILSVDGKPIVDDNGTHIDYLRGPVGSTVQISVQTPGQEPRQVTITRQKITGSTPVPHALLTSPDGRRIGYLLLTTFAEDTVGGEVGQVIAELAKDAPLDGLIIDNRQNSGGADTVTKETLGYFTQGTLGYFVNKSGTRRPFTVVGTNEKGSASVPLVVLIGKDTASFGEMFSGVLRDNGRATLIGQSTAGLVELLHAFYFEDGSRAWIAHELFRPAQHPDQNWDKIGVAPDLQLFSNWDEVTLETDPVVQAALSHLDSHYK